MITKFFQKILAPIFDEHFKSHDSDKKKLYFRISVLEKEKKELEEKLKQKDNTKTKLCLRISILEEDKNELEEKLKQQDDVLHFMPEFTQAQIKEIKELKGKQAVLEEQKIFAELENEIEEAKEITRKLQKEREFETQAEEDEKALAY